MDNQFQYSKNEVLLEAQNIYLNFGEKKVLRDVNFTIKNIVRPNMSQGQVISLIGKSGCGKTQLLRILGGLGTPTSGQVVVNINGTPEIARAGFMGLVPQDYHTFVWRKVRKILEMSVERNKSVSKEQRKEVIEYYANEFQLTEHLDKYPMQLSGGQRQRVSITQQLLTDTRYLLMDEPFSGLDSLMIDKTTSLINKVATSHEHQTIIIVSHDLSNSLAVSDTAILLSNKDNEGSTVVKEFDLIELGLAWRPDIKRDQKFQDLLQEIKHTL